MPFHRTVELERNPEPPIEIGVSTEPAATDGGVTVEIAGTGFDGGGGLVDGEFPPPPAQPTIKQIQTRSQTQRTHLERFIDDSV